MPIEKLLCNVHPSDRARLELLYSREQAKDVKERE
jgi:hypothetical protein